MARRYPSYTRTYIPLDRRDVRDVSYRDRWLGSRNDSDSYRHRSSSPERYRQAAAGSNYSRSRSWETSTSVSSRERTRDSSYLSRAYPAPARSYGRSISFGKDSYLSPVTAPRKSSAESYTGGILKNSNQEQPVSILTRGGSGDQGVGGGARRQRHNTLTFGVSGEDLDRARNNIQKYTRRLSDDTRPTISQDRPTSKTSSRYSLPDVFDSLSGSRYYDRGLDTRLETRLERQQMVENIMQSRGMTGGAATISSSPLSSSLPSDISSLGYKSSLSYPVKSSAVAAPDQTLKSLQKHYMNAITSLNPNLPNTVTSEKAAVTEDGDKKPTELIDDILKLWEESQSDNRRLRLENNALKLELQTTKNQLELAVQASAQNSESDNQKEEKLVMEKKIGELEDALRQYNISSLTSDQAICQLKEETCRLKEENAGLIKAISKLSN